MTVPRGALQLFIKRIRRTPGLFLSGVVCMLLATVGGLTGPWLFGLVIDRLLIPSTVENRQDLILAMAAVYLFIEGTRVLFSICQEYVFTHLGQRFMHDLRRDLFSHVLRTRMEVFDQTPVGRLTTRVTNDISALGDVFTSGFITVFGNILMTLGIMIQLLRLHLTLGLMAISLMPLLVAASVVFSKRLTQNYRVARQKLSSLNAALAENIQGMKTTHLFNRQPQQEALLLRTSQSYREAQLASLVVFAHFIPTINVVAGASMAIVIWKGGHLTQQGIMTVGTLSAFFAYVMALFQPLREIADKWNVFLAALTSLEGIHQLMNEPSELEPHRTAPASPTRGHIRFEDVSFRYQDGPWILKNITLEIQPGEYVAVVGPSGSGKTTLMALLMRFYEPQQGRILLDGKDIREISIDSLRARLGYVAQDSFHSHHDPKRSQGEHQRMAFERMKLRNPPVWILDEATANLDSSSENILLHTLWKTPCTILTIAHRLSSLSHVQRIFVFQKGNLIEQGSHQTLMSQDGLFRKMVQVQRLEST